MLSGQQTAPRVVRQYDFVMSANPISLDEIISSAGRQLRQDFAEIQKCNPHAAERGSEAEETLKQFLKENCRGVLMWAPVL